MKIFLDTANFALIKKYNDMGLVDGITTNPSLLAKEAQDPADAMRDITSIIKGDVSLEVVATDYDGMLEEGRHLYQTYGTSSGDGKNNNVVVKVPMTPAGLAACRQLTSEGIPVNVTLIFSANQAILAAKSGAKYVSPFIGRIDDTGHDGMRLVADLVQIFRNFSFSTQILVASVRHPVHVKEAAMLGADIVTLPPAVLEKMLAHPLTKIGLDSFLADWKKLKDRSSS